MATLLTAQLAASLTARWLAGLGLAVAIGGACGGSPTPPLNPPRAESVAMPAITTTLDAGPALSPGAPAQAALVDPECERDGAKACERLADAYLKGAGTLDKAVAHYERACELDRNTSCLALGMIYRKQPYVDFTRAHTLFFRACSHGLLAACMRLDEMTGERKGGTRDEARALAACAPDHLAECGRVVEYSYHENPGQRRALRISTELRGLFQGLDRACTENATRCVAAAMLAVEGAGVEGREDWGLKQLRAACNRSEPMACYSAGRALDPPLPLFSRTGLQPMRCTTRPAAAASPMPAYTRASSSREGWEASAGTPRPG